ncbi:MAG TPA: alpha/beta family hydrolase [Longimicrobiales bacterium]|nr:alpha/beta family hydrolase [Longimicrobiales bacterium]
MKEVHRVDLRLRTGEASDGVSALFLRPGDPSSLFVFGHGAGAGMRHPFMEAVAERLAGRGVATLRYQFPYMEQGRKAPDRAPALVQTVRAAVAEARRLAPGVPLVAGGKSMGGRMTSTAASEEPLEGVGGLAFFGFPLHASGRPSTERGAHLSGVGLPMLFLQGSRDALCDLSLLRPFLGALRPPPALHVVDGADHGFHVLKRSGRSDADVLDELGERFARWVRAVGGTPS